MSADTREANAGESTDLLLEREPLRATVVTYRDSPDRCTVAPANVGDERRLTTWLSVNADAMVPLDGSR